MHHAIFTIIRRAFNECKKAPNTMTIPEFNRQIISGPTGFKAMVKRQQVAFADRDLAVAEFVIRCLANPRCEGSQDVIDAILKQRQPVESVTTIHL